MPPPRRRTEGFVPPFPLLFLLGRPASGKSELIDFMRSTPTEERMLRYHIGSLTVVDDFPILWQKFIEDDVWERVGGRRLFSERAGENYRVSDDGIWPFLTEMLRRKAEDALDAGSSDSTLLVEFSRGTSPGYRESLEQLSPLLARGGAILYLDVSFEESWRRNVARYDAKRKAGILTHSVPRVEMERTYAVDDWRTIAAARSGWIGIADARVPFVRMGNEPELVEREALDLRYHEALTTLHGLWIATEGAAAH
jgi:hypothetical protein